MVVIYIVILLFLIAVIANDEHAAFLRIACAIQAMAISYFLFSAVA